MSRFVQCIYGVCVLIKGGVLVSFFIGGFHTRNLVYSYLVQFSSCLVAESPVEEGESGVSWVQANGSVQIIYGSRVHLHMVLQCSSA